MMLIVTIVLWAFHLGRRRLTSAYNQSKWEILKGSIQVDHQRKKRVEEAFRILGYVEARKQYNLELASDEVWKDVDLLTCYWGGVRCKKQRLRTNVTNVREAFA